MNAKDHVAYLALNKSVTRKKNYLPIPKEGIPENGPVDWNEIRLDDNIPLLKFPKGIITFTKNKVTKSAYKCYENDFILTDPNLHNADYTYEPLHDPALKNFMNYFLTMKRISVNHLINQQRDVICSFAEFNKYRRYLNNFHLHKIHMQQIKNDNEKTDRGNFELAERLAKIALDQDTLDSYKVGLKQREKNRIMAEERRQKYEMKKLQQFRATEHVNEVNELKRMVVREKLEADFARVKQEQLRLTEKIRKRNIILKRKWRSEHKQLKLRLQCNKMKKLKLYNEKIEDTWRRRNIFRSVQQSYIDNIIRLHEEYTKLNILKRERHNKIQLKRKEQQTARNLANLIRERYESKSLENLIAAIKVAIKYDIKKNAIKQLRQSENDPGQTEDIHSVSSYTEFVEDLQKADDEKKYKEFAEELRNTEDDKKSSAININDGIHKIVVRYKTPEESAKGLIDNPSIFANITDQDIKLAVQTSMNTFKHLNIDISAYNVMYEARKILYRMANRKIIGIPKDEAVLKYVRKIVSQIFEDIKSDQINILKLKIEGKLQEIKLRNKKSVFDKKNKKVGSKRSVSMSFKVKFSGDADTVIGDSAYGEFMTKMRPTSKHSDTKTITLKTLAKNIFKSQNKDELKDIPDDMNVHELNHLYDFEKLLIISQSERLTTFLILKMEQEISKNVDFIKVNLSEAAQKKIQKFKKDPKLIISYAIDSVLTLPEKNPLFSNSILTITDYLIAEIFIDVSKKFKEYHKQWLIYNQKEINS